MAKKQTGGLVPFHQRALRYKGKFLSRENAALIRSAADKAGTGAQNFIDRYPDAVAGILKTKVEFNSSLKRFILRLEKGEFKGRFFLNPGPGFKEVTRAELIKHCMDLQKFIFQIGKQDLQFTVALTHTGKRCWVKLPDAQLLRRYLKEKQQRG